MNKFINYMFLTVLLGQSIIYATPLHEAAKVGNIEKVIELLQSKTINIDELNEEGHTALGEACWRGHIEVVRVLLGAKPGADTKSVALRLAMGKVEIVKELLKANADFNTEPGGGETFISLAEFLEKDQSIAAVRQFSIEHQIQISDIIDISILDKKDPGRYKRDFEAYGLMLEKRRTATRAAIEEATKIPAKGPASIIQEYLGDD